MLLCTPITQESIARHSNWQLSVPFFNKCKNLLFTTIVTDVASVWVRRGAEPISSLQSSLLRLFNSDKFEIDHHTNLAGMQVAGILCGCTLPLTPLMARLHGGNSDFSQDALRMSIIDMATRKSFAAKSGEKPIFHER